jgi:hypothetical protein
MADDKFDKEETERRFFAALRGARLAGPQHKESVTPKRPKPQRKVGVSKGDLKKV